MSFKMFTVSPNVRPTEDFILTFGKWKGCSFHNVPIDYRVWLMSQPWFVSKFITYKTDKP